MMVTYQMMEFYHSIMDLTRLKLRKKYRAYKNNERHARAQKS